MPTLKELDAYFIKHAVEKAPKYIGRNRKDGSIQWGGFPHDVLRRVKLLRNADGISFKCPKCFKTKHPHRCHVFFVGSKAPDRAVTHNSQGHPVRWNVKGTNLDDLSTSPSILLLGGCNWHGYITNGQVSII